MKGKIIYLFIVILLCAGSVFIQSCFDDESAEESPIVEIYPKYIEGVAPPLIGSNPLILKITFKGNINANYGTIKLNGVTYQDGANCIMTYVLGENDTLNVQINSISSGTKKSITISGFHNSNGNLIPSYDNQEYCFIYDPVP